MNGRIIDVVAAIRFILACLEIVAISFSHPGSLQSMAFMEGPRSHGPWAYFLRTGDWRL